MERWFAHVDRSKVLTLVALTVGLGVATPVLAGASEDSASPQLSSLTDDQTLGAADEAGQGDTPEARAERELSRTRYAQLDRAEALALARDSFGGVVDAPVDPLDESEIVSFVDDFTARVDQGAGEPDALVRSLSPLRTDEGSGDAARVDLDLVDGGPNSLEPDNALVASRFPRDAGGFVSVGSGVRLRVVGASGASLGQLTHGKLFYANAIDGGSTDLLLVPKPAGLELLLQVRAAASPERYELAFDLPAGARLEEATHGFVRVIAEGGDVLATIAPPAAWDADSKSVPVSYEIDGTTLAVNVDHHGRDLLYPLLVDPIIAGTEAWLEHFDWSNQPGTDVTGWRWDRDGTFGRAYSGPNGAGVYQWSGGTSSNTLTYQHGKWSQYAFEAPGAGVAPPAGAPPSDAYVNKAWFYLRHYSPSGQNTCVTSGIRRSWSNSSPWEEGRFYRDDNSITPGNSPWDKCSTDVDSRWHCLPRTPACDQSQYRNAITSAGTTGNAAAVKFWMNGDGARNGSAYVYLGGGADMARRQDPADSYGLRQPEGRPVDQGRRDGHNDDRRRRRRPRR